MEWKCYLNNRMISEHPSGFYVIKPADKEKSKPIFCPVCDFIMVGELDKSSYEKFECCDSCATIWAYPNKEKWNNGWRPSIDEVTNKYNIRHT
jgi:hypothetical protein